jgi:hypothetical protein
MEVQADLFALHELKSGKSLKSGKKIYDIALFYKIK